MRVVAVTRARPRKKDLRTRLSCVFLVGDTWLVELRFPEGGFLVLGA
jgi:hypothetical protein